MSNCSNCTLCQSADKVLHNFISELDVETSHHRVESQKVKCKFGSEGVCCRICANGPCKITPKSPRGVCGATADTIVARNFLRSVSAGSGCYIHVIENTALNLKAFGENKEEIKKFVNEQSSKLFKTEICEAFLKLVENTSFTLDLGEGFIDSALDENIPKFTFDLSLEEIRTITDVFMRIIDSKSNFTKKHSSGISEKAGIMADYYKYSSEEKIKLIIAANLHDLGKLAIPNKILDKPGKLTDQEFDIIKTHAYYTRAALSKINGFEDITEWAANHHEKLNGCGYPYGKSTEELDFNSRLMACIDIYQALTEERPYRTPLRHDTVIEIMTNMANEDFIDKNRVEDINKVFR